MVPPLPLRPPRRHVSVWRLVGIGTWLWVACWSTVVLVGLGLLRDPAFLTLLGTAVSVAAATTLLVADVPAFVLLFVVAVVTAVVIPLRYLRLISRTVRQERRTGVTRRTGRQHADAPAVLLEAAADARGSPSDTGGSPPSVALDADPDSPLPVGSATDDACT